MLVGMDTRNYIGVTRLLGWLLMAGALACPFLTPPGEVNGAVLLGVLMLIAAALLLDRGSESE